MAKKANGKKIGVFGHGEVGSAIAQFYQKPRIKDRDLKRDDDFAGVEVLHVCLPYGEKFNEIVQKEIEASKPQLTIIHSTVVPGTTKALAGKFGGMVVHSQIRGVHPHLHKGIRTFVKFIGAESKKAGLLAQKHFKSLGVKAQVVSSSTSTEVAKLLDTTYYGVAIAWHGEMKKLCDKFGVDFDDTVTAFNQTYNEGYTKLGKKHVVRPVLSAPGEYIGGHCIIPNAKLLKNYFDSKALDMVLDYDGKEKSARKVV